MRVSQALLDSIFTGYNAKFQTGFAGVAPKWPRVAMETTSRTAVENYGWLGQMPRIREWIGDRVVSQLDTFGYQIRNRTFESTFALKREQVEDDQFGLLSPAAQELGRSVAAYPDELLFGALAAGWGANCFDGQFFFDTDHPVLDVNGQPQSVSNMQAGANAPWYLLDTSRAVKPLIYQNRRKAEFVNKTDPNNSEHVFMKGEFLYGTDFRCNAGYGFWQLAFGSKADLTSANFRAARQAMMSFTGDHGRPLGVTPTLLVVPVSLEAKARDLLLADRLPNGASNTDYKLVDILVAEWLPNA